MLDTWRGTVRILAALVGLSTLTSCLAFDVQQLSSDAMAGRDNQTAGGEAAADYIVRALETFTTDPIYGGDAPHRQSFPEGENLIGVIEGTVRPYEYVMIGAHYDHEGTCGATGAADRICNGATDNATGAAMVIEAARRLSQSPPDRSVIFVLWDAEEDGLLGSRYYVENPVIALEDVVAYINLDIQGANLLPSLKGTTFAVGAESGGSVLQDLVADAYAASPLDGAQLSSFFGQARSDYAPFLSAGVSTVFFTDSTGPCYHTPQDEFAIVDVKKLRQEMDVAYATLVGLANAVPGAPGTFRTPTFQPDDDIVYADAVNLLEVLERSVPDWGRFTPAQVDQGQAWLTQLTQVVVDGPGQFGFDDVIVTIQVALWSLSIMATGPCDSFH